MRRLAWIAAIASAGLGVRAARADTVGAVALAPDKGPVPADAVARARDAIEAGAIPVAELARFRRVAELSAEGWRAYSQVAADYAASRLGAAREGAEGLLAVDGGLEIYADVSLRLAAVLDQLGRKEPATQAFRIAAAIDPGRPVTTAEF